MQRKSPNPFNPKAFKSINDTLKAPFSVLRFEKDAQEQEFQNKLDDINGYDDVDLSSYESGAVMGSSILSWDQVYERILRFKLNLTRKVRLTILNTLFILLFH